jgi:hypothetical protein
VSLPDLDAIIAAAALDELPGIAGRCHAAALGAELRIRAAQAIPAGAAVAPVDNLSVEVGARRLGISASWVYKNAAHLPFVVRIGRRLVCDSAALERWAKQRRANDAR